MATLADKAFIKKIYDALSATKFVEKVDDDYYIKVDAVRIEPRKGEVVLCSNGEDVCALKAYGVSGPEDTVTLTIDDDQCILFPIKVV